MPTETKMFYWLNPNRPEMQFKTNGLSRWARRIGETAWKYHEGSSVTFPSPNRYMVTEQELEDRPKV